VRHPIRGLNEVIHWSHLPAGIDLCVRHCVLLRLWRDIRARRGRKLFAFKSPVFSHFVMSPRVDACGIIYDLYVRGDERHVNGALSNDRLFVLQTEGAFRILPTMPLKFSWRSHRDPSGLFSVRDARRIHGRRQWQMHKTAAARKENEAPQMEALKYHRLRAHNVGVPSSGNFRKNMRNSAFRRLRR